MKIPELNENGLYEDLQVTLDLDDGRSLLCDVVTRFPMDGKQYIVVAPVEETGIDDLYIYRFSEDEEGEPVLDYIEDDEEYEAAADRFDELLDEAEFDEWVEE